MSVDNIKELAQKLAPAAQEIINAKGPVSLFALFQREAANRCDLVIAAPWVKDHVQENLTYVVTALKRHLSNDEMVWLSRVVFTSPSDDHVRSINTAITTTSTQQPVEVERTTFFGMPIDHAMIFTSTGEMERKKR
jgi:hypothetical protein